jgi:putative membrane protein
VLFAGLILAALAAVLHVYLFYLESIAWTSREARRVFRTTPQQAEELRLLAFNQGFYNLFLAALVTTGAVAYAVGATTVGLTLLLAGTGCMLAAAVVLALSSRAHRRAAVQQGVLPLLAVLTLTGSLV